MFKFIATGNLTKDATSKEFQHDGVSKYIINFSLAVNDRRGERSTFLNCIMFSKSDKLIPFLTKGKAIIVEGNWYENKEHEGKYYQTFQVNELEFQRGERSESAGSGTQAQAQASPKKKEVATAMVTGQDPHGLLNEDDDDLPF